MEKAEIINLYQKEETAKEFDQDRSMYSYQKYKHYFESKILKRILAQKKDSLKILDVACGTGRMLPEVFSINTNADYTGLDTSESMTKILKEKAEKMGVGKKVKIKFGDATKIPFEDNSFDIVYSFHLLWHIPEEEQKKVVTEMLRVCKKDGFILFDSLNKNFIFDDMKKILGKKGRDGIHKLKIKDIKNIFRGKKIRIEKLLDAPIKNTILYSLINPINKLNKFFPKRFYHMLYFVVRK